MHTRYNVYLSGGGLKGAYQYGFFKELYRRWPEFPLNRVYGVSVGAINSMPIVLRKMEALDRFWSDASSPFDLIVEDWPDVLSMAPTKKPCGRVKAYLERGSLFKNMNRGPLEDFLNGISDAEWATTREKLYVITYSKRTQETRITRCATKKRLIETIAASARFPGLFDSNDNVEIDGIFANVEMMFGDGDGGGGGGGEKWLCLDIKHDPPSIFLGGGGGGGRCRGERIVYRPKISRVPVLGQVASLISNRAMLDDMIDNGREDAADFVRRETTTIQCC